MLSSRGAPGFDPSDVHCQRVDLGFSLPYFPFCLVLSQTLSAISALCAPPLSTLLSPLPPSGPATVFSLPVFSVFPVPSLLLSSLLCLLLSLALCVDHKPAAEKSRHTVVLLKFRTSQHFPRTTHFLTISAPEGMYVAVGSALGAAPSSESEAAPSSSSSSSSATRIVSPKSAAGSLIDHIGVVLQQRAQSSPTLSTASTESPGK